jgi:hypothetical protein
MNTNSIGPCPENDKLMAMMTTLVGGLAGRLDPATAGALLMIIIMGVAFAYFINRQ